MIETQLRRRETPGVILAAPSSGAGKTTLALGLMRALQRRGLHVQPFKCGPDYIDPAFHAAAAGRASYNLDTWGMRPELIADLLGRAAGKTDIAIVEGVMGLFDGGPEPGQWGRGSTADVAALTGWPVILILDVSSQAETAAAIALGCKTYRDDVHVAGVILNRVASPGHETLIRPAIERLGLPVLGSLGRRKGLTLPERHLGLVQANEVQRLDEYVDSAGDMIAQDVALDTLISLAAPHRAFDGALRRQTDPSRRVAVPPPGQRIALAWDRAFSFVYPHVLDGWTSAGAEVLPFSPLADEPPDPSADAVWLPGGYPELYADVLSASGRFHGGLRRMAERNAPVHGECGGYMVLGEGLEDASGARRAMAGLLGLETSFARRKLHLGYRRGRLLADSAVGSSGSVILGHEFHFASVLGVRDEPLFAPCGGSSGGGPSDGDRGSRRGSVTGSFFHAIDREVS